METKGFLHALSARGLEKKKRGHIEGFFACIVGKGDGKKKRGHIEGFFAYIVGKGTGKKRKEVILKGFFACIVSEGAGYGCFFAYILILLFLAAAFISRDFISQKKKAVLPSRFAYAFLLMALLPNKDSFQNRHSRMTLRDTTSKGVGTKFSCMTLYQIRV